MQTYILTKEVCFLESGQLSFGKLLNLMISNSTYSKRQFYEKLNIKKAYFYDILGGRTNPPPEDKQFEIIRILKPDDKTRNLFFELAARERNEFPADLKAYLNTVDTNEIRTSKKYLDFINKIR